MPSHPTRDWTRTARLTPDLLVIFVELQTHTHELVVGYFAICFALRCVNNSQLRHYGRNAIGRSDAMTIWQVDLLYERATLPVFLYIDFPWDSCNEPRLRTET